MNIFNTILIQPLANGLALFYNILGKNMGVAVIGFGLFLRILLMPLTKKYTDSMKKMKEFGPQLNKLKEKYKDDKKKLLEAQTEFYKQKGINPGGGCLPYLLQIVVLIALFNVFNRVLTGGDIVSKLNELLYPTLRFPADTVINTRFLYLDITQPDSFGVSFLPFNLPGPILILAALFQFGSAKIMQPYDPKEKKSKKNSEDDMQASMQQSMIYTFPLFTIIFGLRFPSGLALYWLLFSVVQAVQQYKSAGWGGLTPLFLKIGLIKPIPNKKKNEKRKK